MGRQVRRWKAGLRESEIAEIRLLKKLKTGPWQGSLDDCESHVDERSIRLKCGLDSKFVQHADKVSANQSIFAS